MKKLFIIATILFSSVFTPLLIFPSTSFAVEGTCSWHGGINCAYGKDWDGSAICNDGWRDSSERYSDAIMCKDTPQFHCTPEENAAITLKYHVEVEENAIESLRPELDSLGQRSLHPDPNETTSSLMRDALRANEIANEIRTLRSKLESKYAQIDRECEILGIAEYQKSQQEFRDQYLQKSDIVTNPVPKYTCPANLVLSGDKCTCGEGLFYNGASCITATQICQSKLGPNSYGDVKQCYCSSGYTLDSTSVSCIKNGTQVTKDDQCKKLGFGDWYNTDKQTCDTCPAGMEKDPSSSSCRIPPKLTPANTPVTPTVPVSMSPKPKITPEKPKTVTTEKHIEVLSTTTPQVIFATTTTDQIAPTTTKQVAPVTEDVKALPPPKPKPLWSRVISWFRFW